VRRPLLVAFVLGCSVSLMTSGRVTLRLAVVVSIGRFSNLKRGERKD